METFAEPKEFVVNPYYHEQRQKILAGLSDSMIDLPIIDLINGFNKLPYCFALQCCYGHFVYNGREAPHNLEVLPVTDTIANVEYRLAYICFCLENSALGLKLFEALNAITAVDPGNIQFCSPQWFWKRQVNTYALQVEPYRFKHKDSAILDYKEALHIEKTRNEFFVQLRELLQKQRGSCCSPLSFSLKS